VPGCLSLLGRLGANFRMLIFLGGSCGT